MGILLLAGCGGGGGTGVIPGPQPTAVPTDHPDPTPIPTVIPDGKGVLQFCSDWASTLFELREIPSENDGFVYSEVQGGTDKIYEPKLFGYSHTSDEDGNFDIYIDPGTYYISQIVDNGGEQEKYYLGSFTITEGQYTEVCFDSTLLTTFIARVRFQFPTSFDNDDEIIGVIATLLETNNDLSQKIFFSYNDNYENKEYFIKAKLPAGNYQFNGKAVNAVGATYSIDPEYIWDISGSVVEKKVYISNLSPAGDSGVYMPSDADVLIGDSTSDDGGYRMVDVVPPGGGEINPDGELVISSFDDSAGSEIPQKVAIYSNYNEPAFYIGYFQVKCNQATPPANTKMLNCQIFDINGAVANYNVLGQDFVTSKTPTVPVFFYGHPLTGFKVDAYPGMTHVGAGNVYLQKAGNLNSEIVNTFPIRPKKNELINANEEIVHKLIQ